MKTTIKSIILAAASLFAAMSCQKEADVPGTQEQVKAGETIQVNINAGLGDFVAADGTKATATPVVRLTWDSSDKVDAYHGTSKISGTDGISVTPSGNGIFAKLEGTISAPSGSFSDEDIITFVYSNLADSKVDGLTFDFSSQDGTIPFVAYATIKYSDLASTTISNKMVEFKFATSVMKIAATNLGGGDITGATIRGINTKVTLAPQTTNETVNITESEKSTITKTAGFDASTDRTRAIFTVGLVPDNNTGRSITVSQTAYTNKGAITSSEIEASKSYTTPASLFSCGKIGDHDYVLIAGTKWATQNLAITSSGKEKWMGRNSESVKVPGTETDVQIGDYFQWGAYMNYTTEENSDKGLLIYKSFSITFNSDASSTSAFTASFTWKEESGKFNMGYKSPYYERGYTHYFDKGAGLSKKDDVASTLWGSTWRMPTTAEFAAMKAATYWAWDGTDCGYYVFMPGLGTSGAAKGTGNITAADVKSDALLFFPAAGCGDGTSLNNAGTSGYYWSSSLYSSTNAYRLLFYSSEVDPQDYNYRYIGISVRPVSD